MKTMGIINGECLSRKKIFPLEKLKIIFQKSVYLEFSRARRGGDVRRQFYIFTLSLGPWLRPSDTLELLYYNSRYSSSFSHWNLRRGSHCKKFQSGLIRKVCCGPAVDWHIHSYFGILLPLPSFLPASSPSPYISFIPVLDVNLKCCYR